jgi:hypothetical protein
MAVCSSFLSLFSAAGFERRWKTIFVSIVPVVSVPAPRMTRDSQKSRVLDFSDSGSLLSSKAWNIDKEPSLLEALISSNCFLITFERFSVCFEWLRSLSYSKMWK